MYICVCNAIRECELRRTARQYDGDAQSLYAKLGKRPQCGQCLDEAEMLVEAERTALPEPSVAA